MTEARLMHQWDHTAVLQATILNVNRGKSSDPKHRPDKLNPFRVAKVRKKPPPDDPEADADALVAAFVQK